MKNCVLAAIYRLGLASLCLLPALACAEDRLAVALPGPEYKLVVEDNFDGQKVNESLWTWRVGKRGGEDQAAGWINALNRKENVTIDGGMMRIRHAHEEINGKMENTCGGLISRQRFGYGYYECRYKPLMLTSSGTHAAFWVNGNRPRIPGDDTKPLDNGVFEIDSSEISSPGLVKVSNNLYVGIGPKGQTDVWPHRCGVPIKLGSDGFWVDAFEYRPDGIIFYDNGTEVARTDYNKVRAQQEVWLTSLCGAGYKTMDVTQLPGEAQFDYFRFYARDWPGANLLANEGFEYNMDAVPAQTPKCWCESDDIAAGFVVNGSSPQGAAAKDRAFYRQFSEKPYKITTSQTLQNILDGTYTASAMVRSSGGQKVATFRIYNSGTDEKSIAITATSEWKRVEIPIVEVKGHSVTIGFTSEADPGQWLEFDDVVFMKPPTDGQKRVDPEKFDIPSDPPFAIFGQKMQSFADGRNYLFPRSVGNAKSVSVVFTMKPAKLGEQSPIERFPLKGEAGWSVQLNAKGDLAFVIGSVESNTQLIAPSVAAVGKVTRVACIFDEGQASIYIDGKMVVSKDQIKQTTNDKTAPGCMGIYWTRNGQKQSYDGELMDVRVYNRAIAETELAGQEHRQ